MGEIKRRDKELAEKYNIDFSYLPEVDEEGFVKMQMHAFMEMFGHMCYNGCNPPFETIIRLKIDE